ncbi:arginine:ornithine antiporter [Haloferax volcanii]|uniref:Arginine:ornithine antiporter n=1 Tax=Haloferax volcanii TaxID=2246 RepID=A0A6C0UTD7_HALVO|nr:MULTISPECIES: Na+/H+ antiporter NhaC family protein [Haloferax]NLV01503.1 arginine:ornithine antiporter [Haloferax alexandrinus]QIB77129.1 arginine:ornithine antiporter [Haloferax alexandrinus]TVT92809.1 arginine:ornithine antiporter [Haloferax volcanii]
MATLSFEPLTYDDIPEAERPSLAQALVPVVGMLVFLSVGVIWLGLDPQLPLLWGIILTGAVGRYWLGLPWARLSAGIRDGINMGLSALLILLVVYMLISTWTAAGTIPALIYYGLDFLSPAVFLPVATLLSAVVTFAIGSSWTTAATLGVAFIGIGSGLGMPDAMTAGAVLTGAYTGDKVSPFSDTTNLAAAVTNTELLTHVRTMRVGTAIALAISLVAYAALGLTASGSIPAGRVAEMQAAIAGSYAVTPLVFAPLVVTFVLALRGYPALPSIVAGVVAGTFTQLFVQGPVAVDTFVGAWNVAFAGTAPSTGVETVDSLLASDGLLGSAWTMTVILASLSLGGILERTGCIAVLAHHLRRVLTSVASLTVGTAASSLAMNAIAADQYMSIVVPGMSFRGLYDDFDLESRNLSRAIESAGTTTSALIPWGTGGAYMADVLGVPTLQYAPYYFLGFLSPLILVAMGLSGWRVTEQGSDTDAGLRGAVASFGDDD